MKLLLIENLRAMFFESKAQISLNQVISVLRQLLNALSCLHELNIVHEDVRLNNLMILSKQFFHVKLTNFEFSTCDEDSQLMMMSSHEAPERWEYRYRNSVASFIWNNILTQRDYLRERSRSLCGKSVNIWSVSALSSELILHEILCYTSNTTSSDEQATNYVDLLLIVKSEKFVEKLELWAQTLNLFFTSKESLLLSFLQKILDLNSKFRVTIDECLTNSWIITQIEKAQVTRSICKRRKLKHDDTE